MSRFRVLLVSHAYVTPFNRIKAEALAASGEAEVTLLVPGRWEAPVPPPAETAAYRLVRLPAASPGRGGGYFYRAGLSSLVMGLQPDLVHVEEEPWSVSAFQFARLKRKAEFRYALFSWENLRKDFRGVRGWMERQTLRSVDLGIGGNEAAARELRRKGVETVHVLPQLGVDPEWFRPGERPPSDVFTMGYAGRMAPEKGVHLLLRAAAGLGGEWRLRILGSGPEQSRLRALAGESAVSDRVEFLPAVPHEGVAAFLRTLDVLVLPSLTTRSWAEQFGHVLIEAMSAETPVVASNSGAIPEVVGEAGLLFPEGDVSALKAALARLRDDPDLSGALGARGRKRVLERFTWDRIAGKTLALYRSMLNHENPSPPSPLPPPPPLAEGGGSARAAPGRSGGGGDFMRGAPALNVGARVFRNSTVLLGGQLAERVLKLVVMAVLARTLGKSSFGLYIFVLTYVEFFHLLTDLGLQTILVREMARGPEKTDALLGAALTIKLIAAFVSAGMAVFLIGFSGAHASAAGLVAWAALGLFLSFRLSSVRQILDSIFQVRLEMRVPVALGVASELLSTLGLLAAAWWGLSLIWFLAIQNLAYLPGAWCLVRLTRGRIRLRPAWSWTTLIGLLKESYPLGLANLFTLAYVKLDILMLAAMRGDEAAGIYAAAYRLIGSLTILPTAILGSLFPLISQYARTAPEALPRIFQKSLYVLMMLALPVAVGGTLLSREIIALVYGERFADAAGVFRILSWAVAFSFLSYLLTSALNAMGRQRIYLALTAAMTVLNVGLNWMWIPRYGYMGAAVATLITECTLMLVGLRLLGGHLKNIELSPIMKYALSAGVMGVVVLFVPIGVLGKVPLAAVVYVGCLAAFRAVSREEWRAYLAAMGLGSGKAGGAVKGRESAHPAGG